MTKLSTFRFDGKDLTISYLDTEQVKEGVECDIYSFSGDTSKDLAIVRFKAGYRTPLQKILGGEKTLEGYIEGEGNLTVMTPGKESQVHIFEPGSITLPIEVSVGDTMRWRAASDSNLTFYEICTPPYKRVVSKSFKNYSLSSRVFQKGLGMAGQYRMMTSPQT